MHDPDLLALAIRIFADPAPATPTDGTYVFGQTPDNEASVLDTACRLIAAGHTAAILVAGSVPRSGYPGDVEWRARLAERGIVDGMVHSAPTDEHPLLSTLSEAESLVRFARAAGMRSVHVVGTPFHHLRAVITTVSVALREHPALRVYSAPGAPLAWDTHVRHSQGVLEAPRALLIDTELERIVRYTAKGDLVPAREVLAYLDARDRR
jgi:hypothetical protein